MNPVGTLRVREEDGTVDYYIKVGENRWRVVYTSPDGAIEGHVSDRVATRWPLFYRPDFGRGRSNGNGV